MTPPNPMSNLIAQLARTQGPQPNASMMPQMPPGVPGVQGPNQGMPGMDMGGGQLGMPGMGMPPAQLPYFNPGTQQFDLAAAIYNRKREELQSQQEMDMEKESHKAMTEAERLSAQLDHQSNEGEANREQQAHNSMMDRMLKMQPNTNQSPYDQEDD